MHFEWSRRYSKASECADCRIAAASSLAVSYLTELSANVQDLEVREALQFYTLAGPLGHLLDADEDLLSDGRFLTFETESLLQLDDKAVIPVLLYLFRRIEKRLDGAPTLVTLDEAWAYLRHPMFRERLRDWLKDSPPHERNRAARNTKSKRYLQIGNQRRDPGDVPDKDPAAER